MSQIFRTDAIVLRSMDYRETSQIVTLFTREKGKIAVLAKGSRSAKSQFGATLQPLSHIQAVIYHKPTREIQTLGETSHLSLFTVLRAELDRLVTGMRFVELVQALLQVEEQNEQVFALLVDSLGRLNEAEAGVENLWLFFQIQLASILGFQPLIDKSEVESVTEAEGYLELESGGIYPYIPPGRQVRKASRKALRAFAILARSDMETVMRMFLEPAVLNELITLVDGYLRFHVEDALPSRSSKVIAQLQNDKKEV